MRSDGRRHWNRSLMARDTQEQEKDALHDQAADWLLQVEVAPDDAAIRAARDAWLRASPDHADAYSRAERAWQLASDVPAAHARRWAAKSRRTGRRLPPAWKFAAFALAACIALVVAGPQLQLRLRADYVTGVGQTRQATLADGSTVDLDTDSAVATRFSASGREASLLSGRAFFQVVPDTQRPFSVHAGNATVVVTGTAFAVDLTGGAAAVAVQSGSVQVNDEHGRALATRLAPGDRLRIDRASGAVTRDKVAVSQVAAWSHGQLVVEDAPIAAVVDELRRYHRGFIVIRDNALTRRPVTGVYDLRDPAGALRAVVQPYAGTVRALTPYLLVVSGG
jgi:transmembrane sensor